MQRFHTREDVLVTAIAVGGHALTGDFPTIPVQHHALNFGASEIDANAIEIIQSAASMVLRLENFNRAES
jgi:hypothetical protein